jgi:hypothetical protein
MATLLLVDDEAGWPEELEDRPEATLVSRILMKPVPLAALLDAVR